MPLQSTICHLLFLLQTQLLWLQVADAFVAETTRFPRRTPTESSSVKVCTMLSKDDVAAAENNELGACLSRRLFGKRMTMAVIATATSTAAVTSTIGGMPARAFDGTGSSAYSGKSVTTKAALKKEYQDRIIADIHDFNELGKALLEKGELDGPAWVNFFIPYARREPDAVGRTYAALADFRGVPTPDPKVFEGGDGYLLANTFTKSGKPPDNTPAVKAYNKVYRMFDGLQAAAKKGDLAKAQAEYQAIKPFLSAYLEQVELPADFNDPIYK